MERFSFSGQGIAEMALTTARRSAALASLWLAACSSPAQLPSTETEVSQPPAPENETKLVGLYLLSNVTTVSPGQEFRVAARFDIEPSWHIYWLNPGEAGLATQAVFAVPDGFGVGEPRYPGPVRFDGGGGTTSYGYEELVVISAPVTAPDEFSERKRISVRANWLACREMCIPGEAESSMWIEPASAAIPSKPANAPMFDTHDLALPVPFDNQTGSIAWKPDQSTVELLIKATDSAEYFPSPAEQTSLVGQLAVPVANDLRLILSYKKGSTVSAHGVIARTAKGRRSYFQLSWSPK